MNTYQKQLKGDERLQQMQGNNCSLSVGREHGVWYVRGWRANGQHVNICFRTIKQVEAFIRDCNKPLPIMARY